MMSPTSMDRPACEQQADNLQAQSSIVAVTLTSPSRTNGFQRVKCTYYDSKRAK